MYDQTDSDCNLVTCQSACEMTHSVLLPLSMESSYISIPPQVIDDGIDDEIMV